MRVYDTPNRYHLEPDIDPHIEDRMIELYGEDWQIKCYCEDNYDIEEKDEIIHKHINLPGLNL